MLKELKALLTLAWPLLIAQVTQTLMGVADTIMAGRYSYTDMAAVAVGYAITLPILTFIQGIALALSPIVSRFQGAGKSTPVSNALHQSIWIGIALSAVVLIIIPFIPLVFSVYEIDNELQEICIDYVSFVLLATPGFAFYQCLRNCCEGLSSTRPTMIIMFVGLLINIPANYVLINGLFGFPELGGAGCGLSTMVVFYLMGFSTFIYANYSKKLTPYQLFKVINFPKFAEMREQFSLGLPIALTLLFEVSLFAMVSILLAPLGAQVVASHQIAMNFSSLMFMLPLSIGFAVAIRIGYHIGNQSENGAKQAVKAALLVSIIIASFTATLTIIGAHHIASLYTSNLDVINMAASLLFFAALFQFSDGIQVVSANSLRGYKDTKALFIISFICYWIIGLPLGIILALTDYVTFAMGARGFWIAFITSLSCAAVLMYSRLIFLQRKISTGKMTAS